MEIRIKQSDNKIKSHKLDGKAGRQFRIDILVEVFEDGELIDSKRKRTTYFKTKKEAINYLDEYERLCIEEMEAKYRKRADVLLDEFLEYNRVQRHWKQSTYKTQSDIVRNQLKPFFNDVKVDEVAGMLISFQDYLNSIKIRKGAKEKNEFYMSDSRKEAIYNCMISFLNFLHEKSYTKENLKIKLGRKIISKPKPRQTELTVEEFNKLIEIAEDICDDKKFIDYLRVVYLTALRKGEAVGLLVEDVNFVEKTITINKTYNSRTGFTSPKTESSVRVITPPDQTFSILEKYVNEIKRLYHDKKVNVDKLPIFMNKDIKPYADKTLDNRFKPIKDEFKKLYGKNVVIHDLRRSCLTNMAESGADFKVVKAYAGHASGETTEQVYVTLRARRKKDELEKFNSFMSDNKIK